MHASPVASNGGPRPVETDKRCHIGKRLSITLEGPDEDVRAFVAGLDTGMLCEIWVAKDGKFT